jgi:endonuclease-3
VRRILATLADLYPEARTALRHDGPFQLLVATILSAQCTDRKVNEVTPALFARFPRAEDLARADEDQIAELIRGLGLWRGKARNLRAAAQAIVAEHGGQVPRTREALMRLPGVGRKTANVILANAFGEPALAVDTHVFRVANRLGLASGRTPEEVEGQLTRRIPRALWARAHHWLIWHGRRVCLARNPRCGECALLALCPTGRRLRTGDAARPPRGRNG